MPCSIDSPCSGFLSEDIVFLAHALQAEMSLRRFTCMNGHSHYQGDLACDIPRELYQPKGGKSVWRKKRVRDEEDA